MKRRAELLLQHAEVVAREDACPPAVVALQEAAVAAVAATAGHSVSSLPKLSAMHLAQLQQIVAEYELQRVVKKEEGLAASDGTADAKASGKGEEGRQALAPASWAQEGDQTNVLRTVGGRGRGRGGRGGRGRGGRGRGRGAGAAGPTRAEVPGVGQEESDREGLDQVMELGSEGGSEGQQVVVQRGDQDVAMEEATLQVGSSPVDAPQVADAGGSAQGLATAGMSSGDAEVQGVDGGSARHQGDAGAELRLLDAFSQFTRNKKKYEQFRE